MDILILTLQYALYKLIGPINVFVSTSSSIRLNSVSQIKKIIQIL